MSFESQKQKQTKNKTPEYKNPLEYKVSNGRNN